MKSVHAGSRSVAWVDGNGNPLKLIGAGVGTAGNSFRTFEVQKSGALQHAMDTFARRVKAQRDGPAPEVALRAAVGKRGLVSPSFE